MKRVLLLSVMELACGGEARDVVAEVSLTSGVLKPAPFIWQWKSDSWESVP